MTQGNPDAPADWVDQLSQGLRDLVDYEQSLERELVRLRRRAEFALGVPDSGDDRDDRVRERVSGYWRFLGSRPPTDYEYERSVAGKLDRLLGVLLEHPVLKNAVYRDDQGSWAVGLNRGGSRMAGYPVTRVLMGLLDHAVEHTPDATAEAFVQMIQKGEDNDLSHYRILLLHGLHVERRYDFPDNLSVIPIEEVRHYLRDSDIRSMLGTDDTQIGGQPIAAVVSEVKWGPVFVPVGFNMDDLEWPEMSPTFRDDGHLLGDALSVIERQPVARSSTHTAVVERQIGALTGPDQDFVFWLVRDALGSNTMRIQAVTNPVFSEERLPECERLFVACRNDERLRLALSRLAASLRRTGGHAAFDKVVDIAIALEVMYQLNVSRGKGDQLSRRARRLIGGNREDLNWIRKTAESIYAARTAVVHDGTLPENADHVSRDAFELARRTVLHIASSGRPEW
ncbi:MAG: HEPN domain-containing protein [Gemmatimonadetes bacterium]|nr:HEPN domain-containing protein [Gemmatimonadota bacterium]